MATKQLTDCVLYKGFYIKVYIKNPKMVFDAEVIDTSFVEHGRTAGDHGSIRSATSEAEGIIDKIVRENLENKSQWKNSYRLPGLQG